ncbi:MAG: trypsin-like peptidase domain-containing protein [Anaerolineales bacterium]|nr:trypsin-like peptidase domain-containing protein [Anaerolineales bacterium]
MKKVWSRLSGIFIVLIFLLVGCGPALTSELDGGDDVVVDETVALVEETAVSPAPSQTIQADGNAVTENTYIDIYERLNPAVVNIRVVSLGTVVEINPDNLPDDHPNIPNFNFPDLDQLEPIPQSGLGSGFVYDKDGHIVTNNHVVANAERIVVTFADDTEVEATLVGTDPGSDLAVIQVDVDASQLVPVTLGDSDALKVGQLVAAIGNPFGLDGSMSTGIVSGLGRLLGSTARTPSGDQFSIPNIVQTDTAINPGNSGGPLLNLAGEVIGVNTAIESAQGQFGGIGYAVPSNTVAQVVPQLIENGRIETPWLGISGQTLTNDLAVAMDLDAEQDGVLVVDVLSDSPAAKAALAGSDETVDIDGFSADIGGDVIVQIDDQPIHEFDDLLGYIVTETAVDDTVTLQVLRDGELITVDVTMEARP